MKPQQIKQVHVESKPQYRLIDITTTLPDVRQTILSSLYEFGYIYELAPFNIFRLEVSPLYDFDEVLAYAKEIL